MVVRIVVPHNLTNPTNRTLTRKRNTRPANMDQEQLKLTVYQNFELCFSKKEKIDELDLSLEQTREWLVEWFFDTRNYALEEYFTGRILLGQMAAAARTPVSLSSERSDSEWATKGKNFSSLKEIRERIEKLEEELFGSNKEVVDIISGAKKEALFKATAADTDKGGFDL